MPIQVSDIRANLNENILFVVRIIGKSRDRRKVFEAIYQGKKEIKTVDDIISSTGLSRVRVLQEAGTLYANHIVEKTRKDNQTAYKKDETYTHHKKRILNIIDHPKTADKYPTKQAPRIHESTFKIVVQGRKPVIKAVTVDDIDSFSKVRKITKMDSTVHLNNVSEGVVKAGLQKIIGETKPQRDWGGEKNDLYTNKLVYKGKRRNAAFALKGRGTQGTLTPKKMGKNGDQIARLAASAADMLFVVYHGKIDESIVSQLESFALAKAMSGKVIYYGTIDGDDLNRIYQAYKNNFKNPLSRKL